MSNLTKGPFKKKDLLHSMAAKWLFGREYDFSGY